MRLSSYIALLLLGLLPSLFCEAQGIQDSILEIQSVNVFAKSNLFELEKAGLNTSEVDTFVLQSKNGLSLSRLLSENTPIFIKSNGRGALSTASFRGTAASHTQVNWNGININSPMLGSVDFSQIPVYLIDNITLKHGSSSISEQSGGLGGTINILNHSQWDNGFRLKYQQGLGSFHTDDEFLSLTWGNKQLQSKSKIYHNYSKNDYTFINYSNPEIDYSTGEVIHPLDTNHNADYGLYGLMQELYLRNNSQDIFSVKYWGQHSERSIPQVASYQGPENNNLNRQTTDDHKLVADWKHYWDKSNIKINSGYAYKKMNYTQQYLVSGVGIYNAVYSNSKENSWYNKAQYQWDINSRSQMQISVDANYFKVSSNDTVSHIGYTQQRAEYALFLAFQKQFFERLNTNLMCRQDLIKGESIPLVPLLGFDYKILKNRDLILKGSLARNHHLPSLNDLYWQPGGNPDLLPEDGVSTELGLQFKQTINQHLFSSSLDFYYSNIDNWILWIPNVKGYSEPMNVQKVISKGVETNIKMEGNWGLWHYRTLASYAYTKSTNLDEDPQWENVYGKQLVYIPLHSANLMFNISYHEWGLTWQHNSYSKTFTTTSNDLSIYNTLPAYFMNDLTLSKRCEIGKYHINGELRIYNLFNENYRSSIYYPMPGRHFMCFMAIEI